MQSLQFQGQPFYFPQRISSENEFLIVVTNVNQWEMQALEWVSPAHVGRMQDDGPMGIVAVPHGPIRSALEMVA